MGLFDIFKQKAEPPNNITSPEDEQLENVPEMLAFKLLFVDEPKLIVEDLLSEAKKHFIDINYSLVETAILFSFPQIVVNLIDATGPAQCIININQFVNLPEVGFQQNWHWAEANEIAKECKYEVLVADLLSTTLPYKQRLSMIMEFLAATIRVLSPNAVYSLSGQKIIEPKSFLSHWFAEKKQMLYCICNVRLYNITETENHEFVIDTTGLNSLGLPDFQIRTSQFRENDIAILLWNYAYHIYDNGDVIKSGNTIEGLTPGSKWKCEKQLALISPERVIINIQP